MRTDDKYANARMDLNAAMSDFIKAAEAADKGAQQIADDVADSLYDASEGAIKINADLE